MCVLCKSEKDACGCGAGGGAGDCRGVGERCIGNGNPVCASGSSRRAPQWLANFTKPCHKAFGCRGHPKDETPLVEIGSFVPSELPEVESDGSPAPSARGASGVSCAGCKAGAGIGGVRVDVGPPA